PCHSAALAPRSRHSCPTRRSSDLIAHHAAQTPAGLPSGLIHGDLFRDNVLWSDGGARPAEPGAAAPGTEPGGPGRPRAPAQQLRSEEHTSELQSRENLVCRLLLEK